MVWRKAEITFHRVYTGVRARSNATQVIFLTVFFERNIILLAGAQKVTFRTEIATFGTEIAPFRNNQADEHKKISVLHYFSRGLP